MNVMKKAKEIQGNMKNLKAELAEAEYAGSSGGDRVQVVVSGDLRVKRVVIAADAMKDLVLLEDLTTAAVNAALDNAKCAAQQKMTELTGGIEIPGLF